MARHRALHTEAGANDVELLSALAGEGSEPAGRRSPLAPAVLFPLMAAIGLGALLFLGGPGLAEPAEGQVAELEFRFGDAFAIDWAELPEIATSAPRTKGPQPMIGIEGRCLGFGRSDWPAWERHPSVAHCLDGQSEAELGDPGVVGVHPIAAGADTWYYLFFADGVTDLDVRVEPAVDSGAASLHRREAVAAMRVPTSATAIELAWRVQGDRYEVRLG